MSPELAPRGHESVGSVWQMGFVSAAALSCSESCLVSEPPRALQSEQWGSQPPPGWPELKRDSSQCRTRHESTVTVAVVLVCMMF